MPRRKLSTTVYLTTEQDADLKTLSHKTKVPAAEYIRQGIDWVREQHRAIIEAQQLLPLSRLPERQTTLFREEPPPAAAPAPVPAPVPAPARRRGRPPKPRP